MAAAVALDAKGLSEAVERGGIVLVDFWASWCGPCRAFAPVFEEVATENADCTFGKVDTEAEPQLAGELGIQAIPTLMIFREQVLLFSEAGSLPKAELKRLLAEVRVLDMAEVHRQIAAEHKAAAETTGESRELIVER